MSWFDQRYDDMVADPFYMDDYEERRRQLAFPKLHVLFFRKGQNPKTKAEQWQARLKNGDLTTVYVPHDDSKQPTAEQEVWLCQQGETVFEKQDLTFEVVSVHLLDKLFEGEVHLRFQLDEKRLVDGKHPWNGYLDLKTQRDISVLCSPDKFGQLPTADKQFWVCRFKKVAHINKRGNFLIAVVELLREDVEAKERHQAELVAAEERRKQQEVERAAEAERSKLFWAEFDKRQQERMAQRRPASLRGPGRGVIHRY